MQFVVIAHDGTDADALSRRLAVREAHLALIRQLQAAGHVLYAAALLNDSGQMAGSMMVVEFADRAALDEWLSGEPYVTGNVWQQIEVRQCAVAPSFQPIGNAG